MMPTSALEPGFTLLRDAIDDYGRTVAVDNVHGLLSRILDVLDAEPLRSVLAAHVPTADFVAWWTQTTGGPHTSGSRALSWPSDLIERVGLQIGACRALANRQVDAVSFAHHHYRAHSRSATDAFRKLGADLLQPLARDLRRVASMRALPAAVLELVRSRPRSADAALDALLSEACTGIQDASPLAHQVALEKLWDAWERAKSLQAEDKKVSTQRLLDAASSEPAFRALLETEARALTDIGNAFRIRHHEASKTAITTTVHRDYLFHRMLAMLQLVLR